MRTVVIMLITLIVALVIVSFIFKWGLDSKDLIGNFFNWVSGVPKKP